MYILHQDVRPTEKSFVMRALSDDLSGRFSRLLSSASPLFFDFVEMLPNAWHAGSRYIYVWERSGLSLSLALWMEEKKRYAGVKRRRRDRSIVWMTARRDNERWFAYRKVTLLLRRVAWGEIERVFLWCVMGWLVFEIVELHCVLKMLILFRFEVRKFTRL